MELMHSHGAADTDVLITFEDFLAGKCGAREAVLAQKQIARLPEEPERAPESITRVEIDDLGYDMRVGNRAGKRKRVIHAYEENELRRSNREKLAKSSDSAPLPRPGRKRKLEQSSSDLKKRKPGRPPGRGPGRPAALHSPGISSKGPLPAGWSVSLKISKKEMGKTFKQYKAPDGQTFYSYAKAQEHWQALGETPLRQPFSDVSKSSRRVARLPSGWEVKAIHRDVGKRQGQVDKHYISPEGEQFESWAQVQEHCKSNQIVIEAAQDDDDSGPEPEPDFDLTDMLQWLHTAAAESPEWPEPGGGPLMQLAFARARAVVALDPVAVSRRFVKPTAV